jgi:hypothetical protein
MRDRLIIPAVCMVLAAWLRLCWRIGAGLVSSAFPGSRAVGAPSGASRASKVNGCVHLGDGTIVFENAAHDLPQRIGYEQKGTDMTAWIEGTREGRVQHIEFPYTRVVCDSK